VRRISIILPTVLLLACSGVGWAQYDDADNQQGTDRWSFHAGAGWLSGNIEETSTWIVGAELESSIGGIGSTNTDCITLSADYYPIKTDTEGNKAIVPLLIGYRKYGVIGGYKAYFGLGAGGRYSSARIPELRIGKGVRFGWQLNTGVMLTPNIFLQARYLAGQHPKDDGMVAAELGYKF
jgi:hypothetical protein